MKDWFAEQGTPKDWLVAGLCVAFAVAQVAGIAYAVWALLSALTERGGCR